eukprot:1875817-Pleurochrysis_carterae.AAC.2
MHDGHGPFLTKREGVPSIPKRPGVRAFFRLACFIGAPLACVSAQLRPLSRLRMANLSPPDQHKSEQTVSTYVRQEAAASVPVGRR